MFRTFNMGLGLVAAVDPAGIVAAESALSDAGETSFRVGEVIKEKEREPAVVIDGVAL